MVSGYNKVFLMGNLTRDPELRYTPSGTPVATLGIACNRKYKDSNGNMQDSVYFARVIVWRRQAETCTQYLKKGSGVFVEGRIEERKYTDKEGVEKRITEIVANAVQFLPKGDQSGDGSSSNDDFSDGYGMPEENVDEDDLPFA